MKLENTTQYDSLDNTCTRIVLFEKYDQYLSSVMLTDFGNFGNHHNIDIDSVKDAMERLNGLITERGHCMERCSEKNLNFIEKQLI